MRKPIQAWREKGIDIAAWEGQHGYSFTIRKSYKDKTTGEWKESKYLYADDLERLAGLLVNALSWSAENNSEPRDVKVSQAVVPKPTDLDDDIPF